MQVAKLVVSDPQKKIPATPLEARIQLDTSLERQVLDLKQARLGLTPTQRAKNELNVSGRLDMSKTNALEGTIKVLADALDLTSYYDIFAGPSAPPTPAATQTPQPGSAPSTAPAPATAKAQEEPAPMQLPVRNLALDMNIGRLYLRELDIANLHVSPQIESNRVRTGPIELAINGAPVKTTAEVNLGVPGYQYAVSVSLDKVPIEPFVNTFKPEQRGKMKGDLITVANISGFGSTGPSLKKHLDGQVLFDLTNANVQVTSTKFISNIVIAAAIFLRLPELTETVVQQVHMQTKIGAGQIDVSTAEFLSPLLAIQTAGAIQMADVLTNSTIQNWPVTIALRKALADRVPRELLQSSDLTNEYVRVANFLRIHGTLGEPKHTIDKRAIASQAIEQIGKHVGDEKTQKALQTLGGLLGGRQQTTNAPVNTNLPPGTATNAPATNKTSRPSLFDLIPKPK
jgi:hypothetical protein